MFSFLLILGVHANSQVIFVNKGQSIKLNPGAILRVNGGLTNESSGSNDGYFENQGTIYVKGDWTNNSGNGALKPTEGKVVLDGALQAIAGTKVTKFNNLTLSGNGAKTLKTNTIVGGQVGVLDLTDENLILNSKNILITNPTKNAISRSSGLVISESMPSVGYGTLSWQFQNSAGEFMIPFGTVKSEPIPLVYTVETPGQSNGDGIITYSTYPTLTSASPNNRELPSSVLDLNNISGEDMSNQAMDRYWILSAENYQTEPTYGLNFTYLDEGWNTSNGSLNEIKEEEMKAWSYDTKWNMFESDISISANLLTVKGATLHTPWVIAEPLNDFFCDLPKAFSPNGDGQNDILFVRGKGIQDINIKIFNRWGELVFESNSISQGWDGKFKGLAQDPAVFAYYLNVTFNDGSSAASKQGNISLIR